MDKRAIEKYTLWAKGELTRAVMQRAYEYGVTEKGVSADGDVVDGRVLSDTERRQRKALVEAVGREGFKAVVEKVSYAWFNRLVALRYMEVNAYLPSRVRVFSGEDGRFGPQILKEALEVDIEGLDRKEVARLLSENDTENLYRLLLVAQCNELSGAMPFVFERIGDYTELLFPRGLLRKDGIVDRLVSDIPEEDWLDQVQIIGWIYQYYNEEEHDRVVNINKSIVKREDIPAATQIFTTDWVVKYMVDNSLGRYWIERHPESHLKEKLQYLVLPKSGQFPTITENVKPQDLTFLDPCMGSGHILVYAFDVLMEIYRECGYSDRDAAAEIVQNNLFGLDIDPRASQLAYFAVIMKARSYDSRFLHRGYQPQLYYPMKDEELLEYGSMLEVTYLPEKPEIDENQLLVENQIAKLNDWNFRRLLSQKYAIVCTNPPYLNKYNPKMKEFVNKNFKDYSGDLFSVYIYHDLQLCREGGYCGYMTPFVWMFIKTYEKLRQYVINEKGIASLIQMEYSAFEEATVPICSFVLKNGKLSGKGLFFRLTEFKGGMDVQKQKVLEAIANPNCGYFYESEQSDFSKIPRTPVAYWISDSFLRAFEEGTPLVRIADSKAGLITADNNRFLRRWSEVSIGRIKFGCHNLEETAKSGMRWFPYNKGGSFRRWYGNDEYVVNWEDNGFEIRNFKDKNGKVLSTISNTNYYFRECVSWSLVTSSSTAFRYKPEGFIFDVAGMSLFAKEDLFYLLALCNSNVVKEVLKVIAPTINYSCGDIANIPVLFYESDSGHIEELAEKSVDLSRKDWDSYETSWDFKRSPLL